MSFQKMLQNCNILGNIVGWGILFDCGLAILYVSFCAKILDEYPRISGVKEMSVFRVLYDF